MKPSHLLSLIVVLVFALSLPGCGSDSETLNELRKTKSELRELKKQRQKLQASLEAAQGKLEKARERCRDKVDRLREEIERLEAEMRQYRGLAARHDSLKNRYSRLKAWSDDLVQSFGPGIYTGSRYDWPLFEKRPEQATPHGVVEELNKGFRSSGSPQLVLRRFGNGTVHLGVDDAAKLTRRMGSFGARSYIRSTVYSLTSLPRVDCVHFHFQEGDHASPGKYCR
jgi:hypothetical protein